MRALFYHPHPAWNGSARAFAAAARGLAARGWHVTFATAEGDARTRAAALGLPVVLVEDEAGVVGASGDLADVLREHFVEVVFVHGERDHLVAAGAVWRAGRGAVVRRVPPGEPLVLGRGVRTAMRGAATGFLVAWPEQAAHADGSREHALGAVVADLGVAAPDAPSAASDDGHAGRRVLTCVTDAAGPAVTANLLRVVGLLAPRHPELRVRLVGPAASDEELRLHAAALGITRRLEAAQDGARAVASADLAWVAAGGDDGAFGALDAMAARVPVLALRGSVPAHYVPDGIAGAHLDPDDVPGTAARIARLLSADADRQAMGSAGWARVARDHGEAAMLDGFAKAASAARDRTRWRA